MKTKRNVPKSNTPIRKEMAKTKRKLSEAGLLRFNKRKAVVEAVQRGELVSLVASLHGVPERNVYRWLAWYRAKGWDGLRDDHRVGRPSKITPEIVKWIYTTVTKGDPRQLKFEFALWTLALIRSALFLFHDIQLSKSSICRLMAQLGLTPQVPVYRSYRRNPNKVRYYLKTRYPKLLKWAKEHKAEVFFADESRVRADGHRGTTWAPVGQTPVVEDSGDRFGVNMISAVSARGAMFFRCFEGKMDSERFIAFIKDLRHSAGRPVVVIVDGGSYHTSARVKSFLQEEGEAMGIHLKYLPPYSPELNPDEQVWNQAKSYLGKLCLATKQDLLEAVHKTLTAIKKSLKLIRSFFCLEHTKYANASTF